MFNDQTRFSKFSYNRNLVPEITCFGLKLPDKKNLEKQTIF